MSNKISSEEFDKKVNDSIQAYNKEVEKMKRWLDAYKNELLDELKVVVSDVENEEINDAEQDVEESKQDSVQTDEVYPIVSINVDRFDELSPEEYKYINISYKTDVPMNKPFSDENLGIEFESEYTAEDMSIAVSALCYALARVCKESYIALSVNDINAHQDSKDDASEFDTEGMADEIAGLVVKYTLGAALKSIM